MWCIANAIPDATDAWATYHQVVAVGACKVEGGAIDLKAESVFADAHKGSQVPWRIAVRHQNKVDYNEDSAALAHMLRALSSFSSLVFKETSSRPS